MKMLTVSVTGARMWTWVRKCPSWFCAGRCPRRPADEQWAGTRGRTAASSSRWAGPPAGSGSGPDTAAPTRCNADLLLSWTDLPTGDMSSGVSVITSVISQSIHPPIHCLQPLILYRLTEGGLEPNPVDIGQVDQWISRDYFVDYHKVLYR